MVVEDPTGKFSGKDKSAAKFLERPCLDSATQAGSKHSAAKNAEDLRFEETQRWIETMYAILRAGDIASKADVAALLAELAATKLVWTKNLESLIAELLLEDFPEVTFPAARALSLLALSGDAHVEMFANQWKEELFGSQSSLVPAALFLSTFTRNFRRTEMQTSFRNHLFFVKNI